jgi:hypothetical protein
MPLARSVFLRMMEIGKNYGRPGCLSCFLLPGIGVECRLPAMEKGDPVSLPRGHYPCSPKVTMTQDVVASFGPLTSSTNVNGFIGKGYLVG